MQMKSKHVAVRMSLLIFEQNAPKPVNARLNMNMNMINKTNIHSKGK